MQDEGIILGTPLHFEDPRHGFFIEAVGAKTVDGLRGDGHQPPGKEDLRRPGQLGSGQKLRFHPSPRSLSACSALRSASINSSRPPSITASILYSVRPMR